MKVSSVYCFLLNFFGCCGYLPLFYAGAPVVVRKQTKRPRKTIYA